MPDLLLFTLCEKVIVDERKNVSLINLLQGIEAARQDPSLLMPKNAVSPMPWAVFTLWKPVEGDLGKQFSQIVQVMWPDRSEFKKVSLDFKIQDKNHQVRVDILGFPIGQVGDVLVNAWIEWDRRRVGGIHTWSVPVTHGQNPVAG